MFGFEYNGTHSSVFGCYHTPNPLDLGRDMPAYDVEEIDSNGIDGGMYIGNRVKARDFAQDCYFEGITLAMREGQMRWLDRNTAGRLIFDDMPYAYYDVRPVKRIEIRQYTHAAQDGTRYSGTFTITFRCYNPFGCLKRTSYDGDGNERERIATGILQTALMPPAPNTQDTQFFLYNCGTERAHTIIRLAGDVGEGLTIENTTTGQQCRIAGLKADEIPPGAYLEVISETGQVWLVMGAERELAFYYHDLGYITLAPCTPFIRKIDIGYFEDSKQLASPGNFAPHMAGQYAHLAGAWRKIHRVEDASVAHLDWPMNATGVANTPVATMNDIRLLGDGVALSKFEIEYYPRVR